MGLCQNKIFQIVIACLIPLIGGWIISMTTMGEKEPWYSLIARPSWNPPDWVCKCVEFLCLQMNC